MKLANLITNQIDIDKDIQTVGQIDKERKIDRYIKRKIDNKINKYTGTVSQIK